jgi:hypothetical protein
MQTNLSIILCNLYQVFCTINFKGETYYIPINLFPSGDCRQSNNINSFNIDFR